LSLSDAGILTTTPTNERLALRALLEGDHLNFCKFFFKAVFGERFRVGPHHYVIARVLEDVLWGRRNRVIINVPPGFTKTMEAVIMFVARALAIFPDARFIHTSFSDPLVNFNSSQTQDVVNSPEYQALWPRVIRPDVSGKGLWRTAEDGGMLAKSARGTITGFRAGRMNAADVFTGAILIDDPLKPDDQFSAPERNKVNTRFNTTMRSRIMVEDVPIIVIMQRLHQDDYCGFLLKGGGGYYWDHLNLPVTIDNSAEYPAEYTHGIPIEHGLPDGPLWPEKFNEDQIKLLMADEYVFASQYMQNPMAAGGQVFKRPLNYWSELPNLQYRIIYGDTAQKDKEQNDFSVFQCWGKGVDGKAYLLDQVRGKWKAPDLQRNAETFWAKHKAIKGVGTGALRCMKIEDKVSGTGLIQSLKGVPVEAIQREKDKYTRALDVAPAFNSGLVLLPKGASWLPEYESELLGFPSASFDDQVDPTMDAVSDMIGIGLGILGVL